MTVFVLCAAFFLSGCGRLSDTAGVHGEGGVLSPGGVHGDSSIGPDIQVGGDSPKVIVIENSGQLVTRSYDFAGFDEVEASMFDLAILPGEKYAVVVDVEKNALDHLRVVVEGSRLKLGLAPDGTYNMVNIPLRARLTMPELAAVALDLGSEATVTGFDCGDNLLKELTLGSSLTCGRGAEQVQFEAES